MTKLGLLLLALVLLEGTNRVAAAQPNGGARREGGDGVMPSGSDNRQCSENNSKACGCAPQDASKPAATNILDKIRSLKEQQEPQRDQSPKPNSDSNCDEMGEEGEGFFCKIANERDGDRRSENPKLLACRSVVEGGKNGQRGEPAYLCRTSEAARGYGGNSVAEKNLNRRSLLGDDSDDDDDEKRGCSAGCDCRQCECRCFDRERNDKGQGKVASREDNCRCQCRQCDCGCSSERNNGRERDFDSNEWHDNNREFDFSSPRGGGYQPPRNDNGGAGIRRDLLDGGDNPFLRN